MKLKIKIFKSWPIWKGTVSTKIFSPAPFPYLYLTTSQCNGGTFSSSTPSSPNLCSSLLPHLHTPTLNSNPYMNPSFPSSFTTLPPISCSETRTNPSDSGMRISSNQTHSKYRYNLCISIHTNPETTENWQEYPIQPLN